MATFNTSSVTNMDQMFFYAHLFNRDIGDWDVSSVTSLFSWTSFFNQDISRWDVSKVECLGNTLAAAFQFNQDLCSWNVTFRDVCQDGRRPFNYRTTRATLCPENLIFNNTIMCHPCDR